MHYYTRNFIWPGSFIQNQNRLQFKVLSALSFSLRLPKPCDGSKVKILTQKSLIYLLFFHRPLLKVYVTGDLPHETIHCKKRLTVFSSPAGLTKLSLAENTLIIPVRESLVTSLLGTGKPLTFFYSVGIQEASITSVYCSWGRSFLAFLPHMCV